MSLEIKRTENLSGTGDLSVRLTLLFANEVREITYPGCFAVRTQGGIIVYDYADGYGKKDRALWGAAYVIGIEHFGDHVSAQMIWKAQERKFHEEKTRITINEKEMERDTPPSNITRGGVVPEPQRIPERPQNAVYPPPTTAEQQEAQRKALLPDLAATRALPVVPPAVEPVHAQIRPNAEPHVYPASEKVPTSELEMSGGEDPENTFLDTWEPQKKPTAHRDVTEPKTKRGKLGKAVTETTAMMLLLGVTLLGFRS